MDDECPSTSFFLNSEIPDVYVASVYNGRWVVSSLCNVMCNGFSNTPEFK